MSKLFDQLKDAAREREGGILLDALARKQQSQSAAGTPGADAPPVQGELSLPEGAAERLRRDAAEADTPPQSAPKLEPSSPPPAADKSALAGLALATAIFAVAVVAWHAAPWRAPQKLKIDPETLKLDRSLDLDRRPVEPQPNSPKGTSPASRPS